MLVILISKSNIVLNQKELQIHVVLNINFNSISQILVKTL